MDLADIQYRARAQREFVVSVPAVQTPAPGAADAPPRVSVTLRRPYPFEVALVERKSRVPGSAELNVALLERELLLIAIVRWEGVRVADVIDQAPDPAELLPCEPAAIELLLNAQPAWANELSTALLDRLSERLKTQDTAAKN